MARKRTGSKTLVLPDFAALLADVKERIQAAQTRAVLAVNAELVRLYWDIGRIIHDRQKREGWGAAVIPRLARELHNELPDLKGFSERNIKLMVQFATEYPHAFAPAGPIGQPPVAQLPSDPKGQLPVAQIPWAHNVLLMQKVKALDTRRWYMEQTLANGWSRNILGMMIDAQAHARQGKAVTNFEQRLPAPQSDLVQQTLKDPYIFDFLTLAEPFQERELETGLILCQSQDRVLAEYSLAGIDQPIGVSTYELTRALPPSLKSALPTVEEIEAELAPKRGKR